MIARNSTKSDQAILVSEEAIGKPSLVNLASSITNLFPKYVFFLLSLTTPIVFPITMLRYYIEGISRSPYYIYTVYRVISSFLPIVLYRGDYTYNYTGRTSLLSLLSSK